MSSSGHKIDPIAADLERLLEKHKINEAQHLCLVHLDTIKSSESSLMWDMIPIICRRLRTLNSYRFKTYQVCETLLTFFAENCNPKEVLLALLTELETNTICIESTSSPGATNAKGQEASQRLRSSPQSSSSSSSGSSVASTNGNHLGAASSSLNTLNEDNCFKAILQPLETTLLRLPTKRNETLKWTLSTLLSHFNLMVPSDHQLEGKERLLLESDRIIRRINETLPLFVDFLETFVEEVSLQRVVATPPHPLSQVASPQRQQSVIVHAKSLTSPPNLAPPPIAPPSSVPTPKPPSKSADPDVQRYLLLKTLLYILDHPCAQLDLHPDTMNNEIQKTTQKIIQLVTKLEPNLYNLFQREEELATISGTRENCKLMTDIDIHSDSFKIACGTLSYLAHVTHAHWAHFSTRFLPTVYDHQYALTTHLPIICELLSRQESMICEKGLSLCQVLIIDRLQPKSLDSHFLEMFSEPSDIDRKLTSIMIFSTLKSHRAAALKVFTALIKCFDDEARLKLIYTNLSDPVQHIGLKSLLINMYRQFLAHEFTYLVAKECLKSGEAEDIRKSSEYLGTNLNKMVHLISRVALPNGAESELMPPDAILEALSVIWLISRRDSRKNLTHFWDIANDILVQFLQPLRKAVTMAQTQCRLELANITNQKRPNAANTSPNANASLSPSAAGATGSSTSPGSTTSSTSPKSPSKRHLKAKRQLKQSQTAKLNNNSMANSTTNQPLEVMTVGGEKLTLPPDHERQTLEASLTQLDVISANLQEVESIFKSHGFS